MRAAIRSAHLLLVASVITCAAGDLGPTPIPGAGGADGSGGASSSSSSSTGGSTPPVGEGGAGGAPAELPKSCTVRAGEIDALPWCDEPSAPADGIELVKKWHYHATGSDVIAILNPPLVANLNDDDGDGAINLCDTPDVLVPIVYDGALHHVQFVVLSGKDGSVQWTIDPGGLTIASPAIVDLDSDDVPEILVTNNAGHVMALSPSGAVLWEGTAEVFDPVGWYQVDPTPPLENTLRARFVTFSAVSVADLEGDGSPEILVGMSVLDAHGNLRFQDPTQGAEFGLPTHFEAIRPVAADLDSDGTMEVLFGHVGYRADGSELFRLPITPGWSHVGDFFGDGRLSVLVVSAEGLTLVSPKGERLWGPVRPPDDAPPSVPFGWAHPAAIVDIDGDGLPEALVNTNERRMVLRIDTSGPVVLRSEPLPLNGWNLTDRSGSTAFDFRGTGPDWLAYHAQGLTLLDGMGPTRLDELMVAGFAYPGFPVVADIDNDGSADVLLRKSDCKNCWPTDIIAYEDVQHRPSPARRLWNQWNYVAGAFREDAKLAPAAKPSSKTTFRVQSRLACRPPEGEPH
ncbi:VCBS repeat-containing protein [Polyangium sp. 15x6]|uniref:FG-GAP repeat domain-containing protein n=1 Tax=Polyangium sp. 15x6 TaxID=3042687 RepID=UPI00249C3920|nr:VCBS repeat-containing protein [Polyangium sp. 15x6]MDI3288140.1 VCBS repeat-containing protein [Polyangium sp. 15x6]